MRLDRHVVRSPDVQWDETSDVVVVGAGAAGFPAAIRARMLGSTVTILEKAAEAGGTMRKSAAWYWIPNNSFMRSNGLPDDRGAFLRYVARLSRPQQYAPDDPRLGMDEREFMAVETIFDHASRANDTLAEAGALKPLYSPAIPDYHATLPEATVPYGRTLQIDRGDGEVGKGEVLTSQYLAACARLEVPIRYQHRIDALVVDSDGAAVGVRASTPDGQRFVGARQGVVFATGGFTHNVELRKHFLQPVIFGGCAAPTNEGDFVAIATELGVPLRNMNFAWMAPLPLEIALAGSPYLSGIFAVPGDSMIWVDKYGNRVVNEKAIYHELAMSFGVYDPARLEYPRLLMFMVWDQRTMDLWRPTESGEETRPSRLALDNYGNVVYDGDHLIRAGTLDDLTDAIAARLDGLAGHTGDFQLEPPFRQNLKRAIRRFNELAADGVDADFHRGESPIELVFNGEAKPGNDTGNPTMYPISESGPYYATIVGAGTLDTKGGPLTSTSGQVLDGAGEPVPGLYAVGNCAASPSAQAYWAGGATIGPSLTFGFLAGEHVAQQPRQ